MLSSPDHSAECYPLLNNLCPNQTSQMNVLPEDCTSSGDGIFILQNHKDLNCQHNFLLFFSDFKLLLSNSIPSILGTSLGLVIIFFLSLYHSGQLH